MRSEFIVRTSDMGESVRVRATSFADAAIRGATKIGMRWNRRKPSTAQRNGGIDNLWVIYGPHDKKSGGQHNIGQVRVFQAQT